MRPTIDEQLAGARRLLAAAQADPGISAASVELLRNADRLLGRVAGSWSAAGPFLAEDNAALERLLHRPAGDPDQDAAERNAALRAELADAIRTLPAGDARAEIGRYLRHRVATDPT